MRKAIKRTLSALMAAAVMTSAIPFKELGLPQFDFSTVASAASVIDSGKCGDSVYWTLYSDGELRISGTGDMENYYPPSSTTEGHITEGHMPPWQDYDQEQSQWGRDDKCIQSVVIENGVTSISDFAFDNLRQLKSVVIPNSVTSIGKDAFSYCFSMTNIAIPDSVTILGGGAFYACKSLTNMIIPHGVQYLPENVFNDCANLKSVSIPNSVTTIGTAAFQNCKSLTDLEIPDSVTDIYSSSFLRCSSLISVNIPKATDYISEFAFACCSNLTSINVHDDNQYFCDIDGVLFNKKQTSIISYPGGKTATTYKIPENVTSIKGGAFYECSNLIGIELPTSVEKIGFEAFRYCTSLTCINIHDKVTSIGNSAFYRCNKLTHIHISENKTASDYAGKYGLPSEQSYYCYDNTCYDSSCPFNTGYKVNKPVDPSTINSNVGTNNPYSPGTCQDNVLTSAVIKYDSEEIKSNLVNTYFKYHLVKDKEDADKHFFQIVCTPVDKDNVLRYEFYKGTELIATSSTDTITVYDNMLTIDDTIMGGDILVNNDVILDGDVFINVVDKNNVSRKTKLKLDIVHSWEGLMETEITLGGDDDLNIAIPDNVPFIGGDEMGLSFFPMPVYAVIKPDGTIRVAANVINKDLLDEDSSWDNYKNCFEAAKSFSKGAPYKDAVANYKDMLELRKYVTFHDPKHCKMFDPNAEFNMVFTGYAEGKVSDLTDASLEFNFVLGIEWHGTITWQTFVVIVPVVIELGLKMSTNVTGDLFWAVNPDGLDFTGELYMDSKIAVDVFGGIGVAKVVSVGASGGGEISSRMILLSNKQRHGFESVDAKLGVSIVAKLFGLKYEHKIAEKNFHIYSRDGAESVTYADRLMLSSIYDQNNYVLAYDSASEEYYFSSMGTEEDNTIISGLFCNASPEIISTENGLLLTYLSSDSERGAANATVLKYMFFSNDTQMWTEAQQLDDNATLDWNSRLYSFNGKTYVIYSQSGSAFDEELTIEEMLSTMKITVAEYDAETNSFINFTDISAADGRYNSMPEFAVIGEKLAAVWVNGSAEDMFNQNSDNSVMYSIYDNGTWSTATTAATNLNTVTSVIAGDIGDETYFCVCTDSDCDLSTTGDSQIILIDSTSAQTVVAQGNVDNVQFAKLPCAENEVLIWYEDGDIKYAASPDETVSLFGESGFTVSNNFIVSDDRILFAFGETEEGSVVYQTVYSNGIWSLPIAVEVSDGNISSFAADNGILIYADTILTSAEDDSDIIDSTSIDIARYLDKYDIVLEAVDFDYTQIKPGQEMDIVLYVTNNTDTALENIDVTIGTVDSTAECSILPGETGEVTVKYIVESVVDDSAITATVSGAKADTDPENNSVQFNFGKTELSLSVTNRIIDNKSYYVAAITNESNIPTGCTLKVTNEAGEEIYTKIIENVPANDTFYHMIKLDDLGCGEKDTLTSEVIADKEEYFTNNNISHEYVAQMDEYLPYVIVAFVDENGTEIARNAYALGDEITAPALPEGMTTWFEYGNPDPKPVSSFDDITHDTVFVAVHPVAEVEQPVAASISYGQSLSNSLLSTGWTWADDTIIPDVENKGFVATKALTDDTIYDYSGVGESFVYDADAHTLTTTVSVNVKPATPSDNTEKTQSISCGSAKINKPQFNGINQEALDGTVSYTYNNEALTYDKLIDRLNEVVDVEEVSVAYAFVPDSSNYSSADGEIVVMISDSLKVMGHSLILSDDIGVTFYMQIPEVFAVNKNAAFKYNVGGTEEKTLSVADTEYTEKGYRFTCNVAPAELTETINAQVVCGDYESEVYTYSAVTYANQVLDNPSVYQDTIPLVKAILNYGTQAQVYFNHNTENLANSILEENDKALSPITADELKTCKYKVADNDKNIDFIGQVIQLKNKVIAKYYFSGDIDPKMCKVNGEQIAAENLCEDENGTYIAIRNIAPDDYDKPFVITVGNVTISNASVFSYLYTALSEEHIELYDIAYSMYAYNKAVEAYIA